MRAGAAAASGARAKVPTESTANRNAVARAPTSANRSRLSQLDQLKKENEQLSRSLNEEAALLEDAKIEISGLNMKPVDLEAWLENSRKQLGGKGNGNATCVRKVRH
ncbi:unnamed protein product [Albugo candida]|uniref:Uncharacterized protein n=1 Tax=Albugo candida TaxID=65357 RepID=A0A024FYD6_9STRA|nr:unnamed protein product [Albugo candida]|eukprot:CCI11684.1 unnamed protein product [Albugo candida]